MVIDFIAAVIVLIILMFIFAIAGITDMEPNYWIWFAEGFFLYKDCFNGRSIGRIILKQQVIDCKTGQVAYSGGYPFSISGDIRSVPS